MPTPEARLGANHGGLDALKRHSIFHGIDWHVLDKRPSPLSGNIIYNIVIYNIVI